MIPVQYVLIAVLSCLGTFHALGTECSCRCDSTKICDSMRTMKTKLDLNNAFVMQWSQHSDFVQNIHEKWDEEVGSVARRQLEIRLNETRGLLNSCLASQSETEKSIQKILLSMETLEKNVENLLKKEFANNSNQQNPDKGTIYCDAPRNPVNGRVSYSSLEYGTELKYECNAGFLLKKHQTRICSEDGSWSNAEPECIEATCDEPQPPKYGSVKLHGELKVNSIATYSCDPGRVLLGAFTTKCLLSGKWTFDAPDCLTEEDRSISTRAPRLTSFTTEIPTHIHLETSTHEMAAVIPNKDCSCTYEHEDGSVSAQIGKKPLKFGDQIKKGEKVSFWCKYAPTFLKFQNGLRLRKANMICTECKNWKEKDVPTCENSQQSDSRIEFAENLDILPGGNVSIQKGVKHRFSCANYWKQPEWEYGQRKDVSVTPTTMYERGRWKVYITYLVIEKEETELHGKYECYVHDQGRRKSTFLHLQVTDYASCPEFSNLTDLRVNYSNGVSIGSTAKFKCLETTKILIGSDSSICQEDGIWSSPLPSCEDSKCSIGNLSLMVPENVMPDISEDVEEHVTIGSVVRLKCNNNQVMTGEREAQCEKQGKWKLGIFQCVPGCVLDLDPTSHLLVHPMKDIYRIGEYVVLSCPAREELSNKVERLMCFFGGWSDSLPECIKKSGWR